MLWPRKAFSLIEVAYLQCLLASLIITSLVIKDIKDLPNKISDTENDLMYIAQAFDGFWLKNNYLPCPAMPNKAVFDDGYAEEARDDNNCWALNGIVVSGNSQYYIGAIPTDVLNISNKYVKDVFGGKFFYVVRSDLIDSFDLKLSRDILFHKFKDIIWFSAESEIIDNKYWLSLNRPNFIIESSGSNLIIEQFKQEKFVSTKSLRFSVIPNFKSLFLEIKFDKITDFKLSFLGLDLEFKRDDNDCWLNNFESYEDLYFDCEDDLKIEFQESTFDQMIIRINHDKSYVFFVDSNDLVLNINSEKDFYVKNIITYDQVLDYQILIKYVQFLPKFEDLNLVKNNENLDFSFLIISNLRNQYLSFNLNGNFFEKGFKPESTINFAKFFDNKEINFQCADYYIACSFLNKDNDYSLVVRNYFD